MATWSPKPAGNVIAALVIYLFIYGSSLASHG